MTREEAKEVFLNRGDIEVNGGVVYDANKWREACSVISKWLEQEPIPKNDLGVDCISRQAVLDLINADWKYENLEIEINNLPSVTPQEPRKGHWIEIGEESGALGVQYKKKMCSVCKWSHSLIIPKNACPNCGAKMVEPQESES